MCADTEYNSTGTFLTIMTVLLGVISQFSETIYIGSQLN